jgi:hypothetical protein
VKSATLPSFWEAYRLLGEDSRQSARKAYRLWRENPAHPSLRFKCVHRLAGVWSVRITRGYRALGVIDGNTITWFWIGGHDEYQRLLQG